VTTSVQPRLLILDKETSAGTVELFPAVWNAAQDLVSSDVSIREEGLNTLIKFGAVRLSPLVAYLVATRLDEPDIGLRTKVVEVMADVLSPDILGQPAPEEVRPCLLRFFSGLQQGTIASILEVCVMEPGLQKRITQLFNLSPKAGQMLANILLDRDFALDIRRQAADMIGLVGFVEVVPAIERLRNRLEARQSAQSSMPFAPTMETDETQLLPALNTALILLKSN
jgi:hypothetical protein